MRFIFDTILATRSRLVATIEAQAFQSNVRRVQMAVLMTAHIPGATQEMINGMSSPLKVRMVAGR
jgi:hypothetical protein